MALADVSQVFNTIDKSRQQRLEAQQLQQQQQQAQAAHDLAAKQLDLQHQHEEAVLAAQQAYERTQQFNTLAQNPAMVRAMGTQTGTTGGQQDDNNPTAGPTGETYSVPSQTPGQQPFTINQPSREQEATTEGQEAALKNAPAYQQAQELQNQKNQADAYRDNMNFYRSEQKDQRDRDSAERVAQANVIANAALERMRSNTTLEAARITAGSNPQRQVHPEMVQQRIQDIANGAYTNEDFNRDSGLSPLDKQAIDVGVSSTGIQRLSDKQREALTSFKSLVPLIKDVDELNASLPETGGRTGAIIRNIIPAHTGNVKALNDRIQSGYGQYAKNLSGLDSTGRIPQQEAQRSLEAVTPDTTISSQDNINKRNRFVSDALTHLQGSLSNIPMAQRQKLIDDTVGADSYVEHPIQNYAHLQSEIRGRTAVGTGQTGQTTTFKEGSKVYNIPNDQVSEFKKDHPNAR